MGNYIITYTEQQERVWRIVVKVTSADEAVELFEANNEDVWEMVRSGKATWDTDSQEDGEAIDTYATDWEVEDEGNE